MNSEDVKRRVFNVDGSSLDNQIDYLHKNKMPFTVSFTGGKSELSSDLYNSMSLKKNFDNKEISFMKKVKNHVVKNHISDLFLGAWYKSKDIRYVDVNSKIKKNTTFENVCCLDVNGAYWQTALLLGVITPELYSDGFKMSKITRLASLGSLAKKTEIYKYDGKNYEFVETVLSLDTENIWFAICYKFASIMQEVAKLLGNDFYFYWVDGIYFKNTPENIELVKSMFNEKKYECKHEDVGRIEFLEKEFKVYSSNNYSHKVFAYNIGTKRTKRISYTEQKRLLEYADSIMYKSKSKTAKKIKKNEA